MNSDLIQYARSLNLEIRSRYRDRAKHAFVQLDEIGRQLAHYLDDARFFDNPCLQLRSPRENIVQYRFSPDGALTPNKDGKLICKRYVVDRHSKALNYDPNLGSAPTTYQDFRYDKNGNERIDHPYAKLGENFDHQVVTPLKHIRRQSSLAIGTFLGLTNDIHYPQFDQNAFFAVAADTPEPGKSPRADRRNHPTGYLPCQSDAVQAYLSKHAFRPSFRSPVPSHFLSSSEQPRLLRERLEHLIRQPTKAIIEELRSLHHFEQYRIEQLLQTLPSVYCDNVDRFRVQLEIEHDADLNGPMVVPLVRPAAPSGLLIIRWYAFKPAPDGSAVPVEVTFHSRDVKRIRFLANLKKIQRILSLENLSPQDQADVAQFRSDLAIKTRYPEDCREFDVLYKAALAYDCTGQDRSSDLCTEVAYSSRMYYINNDFLPYTQQWERRLALYFANGYCAKLRDLVLTNASLIAGCNRPTPDSVVFHPPDFDDLRFES